ncbi:group II intron maturase-specific domain-containing protein [Rhizobium sp. NXC14]|uniref:group II intron maturase-specific domain-containing protein n=1 Tax=Rhizobium sp. NXC14 TaxID=1981173 RepID=UPI001FDA9A8E|nr:group II intron maturase-specific domain-containing protein [Rhizobium sp. NXC14]
MAPARRTKPYIYSEVEIQALLAAALSLPPANALRRWTYHCLFGLIAVAGLRHTPAASPTALKSMRTTIKSLNIPRQTPGTLAEIAKQINPLLRGWIAYYGRFSRSALFSLADYVNRKLKAWIMRKYKRFRFHKTRASQFLRQRARDRRDLFVHWQAFGTNTFT